MSDFQTVDMNVFRRMEAEIERLRAAGEHMTDLKKALADPKTQMRMLYAQELEAKDKEIERLREKGEMFDWLVKNSYYTSPSYGYHNGKWAIYISHPDHNTDTSRNIITAIKQTLGESAQDKQTGIGRG